MTAILEEKEAASWTDSPGSCRKHRIDWSLIFLPDINGVLRVIVTATSGIYCFFVSAMPETNKTDFNLIYRQA